MRVGRVARWRARVAPAMAALALFAAPQASCRRQAAPHQAPPPPEVEVATVEPRTIPLVYSWVGQTEASKTVEVRARVSGFLLRRTFEEGKAVKRDDVLF